MSVTEPVGVVPPALPLTVTFTESAWAVVMLEEPSVTVRVGVAAVTVIETEAVAVVKSMVSVGVKDAESVYDPAASTVAWVTAWGVPPFRVAAYAKLPATLLPFRLAVASSIPVPNGVP